MAKYTHLEYPNPHSRRAKEILAAHPEVKTLFGPDSFTAWCTFGVVILQTVVALALWDAPWWAILLAAYTVGAISNHAMFVVIHDCSHNLIFKSAKANNWMGIIANLPIVFPSAISFKKYHLLHHRYLAQMELDADLASPWEAKLVGNSSIMKALWLLFFFVFEGIVRPARLKSVKLFDRWTYTNIAVEFAYLGTLYLLAGWKPVLYLFLASIFSVGLHPVGARWIQEHYLMKDGQETYSYYGPYNKLSFNVGYHNEHHDLMMIPWTRLPKLKAMAPEFYDNLYHHTSYTKLLFRFIFDKNLSLYSRVVRPTRPETLDRMAKLHTPASYDLDVGSDATSPAKA